MKTFETFLPNLEGTFFFNSYIVRGIKNICNFIRQKTFIFSIQFQINFLGKKIFLKHQFEQDSKTQRNSEINFVSQNSQITKLKRNPYKICFLDISQNSNIHQQYRSYKFFRENSLAIFNF